MGLAGAWHPHLAQVWVSQRLQGPAATWPYGSGTHRNSNFLHAPEQVRVSQLSSRAHLYFVGACIGSRSSADIFAHSGWLQGIACCVLCLPLYRKVQDGGWI